MGLKEVQKEQRKTKNGWVDVGVEVAKKSFAALVVVAAEQAQVQAVMCIAKG